MIAGTRATLTPFLPDPSTATGAAAIVAPGGGFRTLSMENEGWDVARALAARGVAAFVLKYRLDQTPVDLPAFERSMADMFSGTARARTRHPDSRSRGWRPRSRMRARPSRSCGRAPHNGGSTGRASA